MNPQYRPFDFKPKGFPKLQGYVLTDSNHVMRWYRTTGWT